MRVLAFASQKSGAGKTTLAGHVAIQAQRAGTESVVLVDVDPDGSLADWFALREELEGDDDVAVERSSLADLPSKLEELRSDGVDLVVIDTPPALNHAIDELILAADLVAIPTRPCAHDLAAAGATVEMVQTHGKPFVFVVNGSIPEGDLTSEVVMALAQYGTVASVRIPRSLAVHEAMMDGRTVMELPDNPAPASEVARLWDYLSKRLVKTGLTGAEAAAEPSPLSTIERFAAEVVPAEGADLEAEEEAAPESAAARRAAPLTIVASKPAPAAPPPSSHTDPAGHADSNADAAAHADAANPEALRRYPRFKYEQRALLLMADGQVDCVVHDISAGGALVAVSRLLKVGENVTLSLDSIGKLPAEIRHCEGGRAGLRFVIDPKQQLFLVKHLSAVIAAASTTVQGADAAAGA